MEAHSVNSGPDRQSSQSRVIRRGAGRKKKKPIIQNFKGVLENKKVLIKRIEELTGQRAVYSFVPRCAYLFEGCAVEKDGSLSICEGLDLDIVRTLLAERLITGELVIPQKKQKETADQKRKKLLEENGDKEITAEEAMEPLGLIKPDLAFRMEDYTPRDICNLLRLIHSRGRLISKATRGQFSVPTGLVDTLGLNASFNNVHDLLAFINEYLEESGEKLVGLKLTDDRLIFTGYPATDDRDVVQIFMQLTSMMVLQCMNQRHVLARETEPTEGNEKYLFRTWMSRLGMIGPEYREARNYLLFPLAGNSAFCTKVSADKRDRVREAEKAARAAQTNKTNGTESGRQE